MLDAGIGYTIPSACKQQVRKKKNQNKEENN